MPVISGQSSSPSRLVFCIVHLAYIIDSVSRGVFQPVLFAKNFLEQVSHFPFPDCPFHWYFKVIGTCFLAFGLMALVSCLVVPHMEAACINELIHKCFWCVWPFCLKNKKMAEISLRYHRFFREMKAEKRAQKLHTDDFVETNFLRGYDQSETIRSG